MNQINNATQNPVVKGSNYESKLYDNRNQNFKNNDNKLNTPIKIKDNNLISLNSNKTKEDQSNLINNKTSSVSNNNKPNMNNNLMNNFLLKSKEQEKSGSTNNNSSIKNTIGGAGINFNNNINYLNLVSNLGKNPIENIKKYN